MTPAFALTLSFDGISLLRRVPGGWTAVGDVALDAADLRAALADLRSEADSLAPNGGQVKLILPNEQIKYLRLPDIGLTGEALETEIHDALDGATPYPVHELRFDWVKSDGSLFIAAVATETLDEAEAFAKSHHFEPVSFAARPPEGQFDGEVFFGPAASWAGDAPEKDDAPLTIVAAPPTEEIEVEDSVIEPSMANLVEDTDTEFGKTLEDVSSSEGPQTDRDERDALTPGAAANLQSEAGRLSVTPPPAAPSFASIRASREAPDATQSAPSVKSTETTDISSQKPRFKLGGARKSATESEVTAASIEVDAPEIGAERKGLGFFSRRKAKDPTPDTSSVKAPPVISKEVPPVSAPRHDPAPAREAVARIAAMRANRDPDAPAAPEAAALPDERQRMTVFGARTEPQVGGKPRFLGLMLTSALLILLLAVAAWASVFLDEGLSRFFDRSDEPPSLALPDVELEPLDGSVTSPPSEEDDVQFAALNTEDVLVPADNGLSDVLPPPAALTPEEADARYAATGIWLRAPEAPAAPPLTTLDDLYVASIDGRIEQFDAVALPNAQLLRNDETYLSQPNPPLPGSRYTLDERGLVVATPEGAVTPEGVRVFAGLPPVVPPVRPQVAEAEPDAAVAPSETTAALQAFRPRTRPNDIVEGNERAQLSGLSRAELASFRPTPRPDTLKAQEEEAQPQATQFAVAQSVEPVTRPRNFSRIVENARVRRETQETQVTQVAAVAPRTVQPSIPSTASVARQATVANAINLRRINLIGVYGKPSNRRALVRLANGRYQKVEVGDRLDGGRVAAIGAGELQYTKNGRNVVLDMPDG
jgi:hypothetical protein